MEELQKLLADMRKVVAQYEEAEREARARLEQVAQGRLMQIGAVRGVEMAIQAVSGLPGAADSADESGLGASMRSE